MSTLSRLGGDENLTSTTIGGVVVSVPLLERNSMVGDTTGISGAVSATSAVVSMMGEAPVNHLQGSRIQPSLLNLRGLLHSGG